MKKRLVTATAGVSVVALLAAVLSLAGVILPQSQPTYAATGMVTTTKVSGITVQNQSATSDATVTIEFYAVDGTKQTSATISYVIPANTSKTWYSPNIPNLPNGFIGSAVVSSDQPVAAIVNTQTPSGIGTDPADPARVGTSSGVASPGTSAYLPQVMSNYAGPSPTQGWSSTIYAQNTISSTATVNAKILNAAGSVVYNQDHSVPAYSTKVLKLTELSGVGNNFVGSAVLTSLTPGAPLAVISNFYNIGTDASTAQFHSYNAMTTGATTLYVPRLVKDYYGYNSGLKVQNVDNAPTDVTVTYYIGGAQGVTQQATIQPNQAWGPYMGSESQLPAGLAGVSGSGSAVITSNGQRIVASINEDNRSLGRGVTYEAFAASQATNTVLLPQVTARFYGYSSGVQFQNVTDNTASGTVTLSSPSVTKVVNWELGPKQSKSIFAPDVDNLTDFNGAAIVTSNQPIVGIANLSFRGDKDPRYPALYGDSFTTYDGLNK